MKRYFFDIVSPETPEHDYSGSEHPSPEAALAVAEMIAIDLGVPADSKWIGWKVCVRDAYGADCASIPVVAIGYDDGTFSKKEPAV